MTNTTKVATGDDGKPLAIADMRQEILRRRRDRYAASEPKKVEKLVPKIDLSKVNPIPSAPKIELTYQELRLAMHTTYQHLLVDRPLTFTASQKEHVQRLIQYFVGDPRGDFDLSKGIYLYGGYGRGKSMLMQVIHEAVKSASKGVYIEDLQDLVRPVNVRPFAYHVYEDIKDKVDSTGKASSVRNYLTKDTCIDDLGYMQESRMNLYGTKIDLVGKIVKTAHNEWCKGHRIYHFTSNLTRKDLQDLHGEGTYSRICEMCNVVEWDGQNHRL